MPAGGPLPPRSLLNCSLLLSALSGSIWVVLGRVPESTEIQACFQDSPRWPHRASKMSQDGIWGPCWLQNDPQNEAKKLSNSDLGEIVIFATSDPNMHHAGAFGTPTTTVHHALSASGGPIRCRCCKTIPRTTFQ